MIKEKKNKKKGDLGLVTELLIKGPKVSQQKTRGEIRKNEEDVESFESVSRPCTCSYGEKM